MARIRRSTPLKELLPDEDTRNIYKRLQHAYVRHGLPVFIDDIHEQKQFIDAGIQFCTDYPETQFFIRNFMAGYSISLRKNKK